jgi:hypothetical protein
LRRALSGGGSRVAREQPSARDEQDRECYKPRMAMFHVVVSRSGPEWDRSQPLEGQSGWDAHAAFMDDLVDRGVIVLGGPLDDELRVVHAIEAASADAVRATLARDPWSESHLRIEAIEPWTIRLDGRG